MTLTRPTIDTVRALLKDGNYTRAASVAKGIDKDNPLVTMLADELSAIGNRKRNGKRGPRGSDKVRPVVDGKAAKGMTAPQMLDAMLYDELIAARDIVDGREEGDIAKAKTLLRRHHLDGVTRGQFRIQARDRVDMQRAKKNKAR